MVTTVHNAYYLADNPRHTQGAITISILWIHWLKDDSDGNKIQFTFHPFLGIVQCLVATGKGGELVGRVSFSFGGLKTSFC